MKQFFLKKKIYTVLLLLFVLVVSFFNLYGNKKTYGNYCKELQTVTNLSQFKVWMEKGEHLFESQIPGKQLYVEIYSILQKVMGKKEFHNFQYIMDQDGMVYYGSTYPRGTDDLEEYADRIKALETYVENNGASFFFCMAPCKITRGISQVNRSLLLNDPNIRMDTLLSKLQQRNVHSLDLRIPLMESGKPMSELFYFADHYWTSKGALLGMIALVDELNDYYGENLDPTMYYRDLEQYDSKVYENVVLGSDGKRIGLASCGLEDFVHLYPRNYEKSLYSWSCEDATLSRNGNLREALFLEEKLAPTDFYTDTIYRVYLDQIHEKDTIINHNNPNGLKVAVLRDAYFSPMAVYLAPMVGELDLYRNNSEAAVQKLLQSIEKKQYDYVIYETYPYNMEEENFPFFEDKTARNTVSKNTERGLHEK